MKKLSLPIILATLMLAACSGKSANSEPEITNPDKPIEVTAGSEFTITVKTTGSPNYHWELAEALDTNIVDYVWKDHVSDNPEATNSSGRDIWRFRAVGPGQTTITLGYYYGMTENARQMPVFTIVVN